MIPYLITALTVFSHWVIGKHELAGWGLYLVIDPMWIAYWFTTGQHHFLPMCLFFLVVHVHNFRKALGRAKALRENQPSIWERIQIVVPFWLGHGLSKLPYFGWYRAYNWLMTKSAEADNYDWMWKTTEVAE